MSGSEPGADDPTALTQVVGRAQGEEPAPADEAPDPADEADGERPDGERPEGDGPDWWRHEDGRWVVGDAGRQALIVPLPAKPAQTRPDTVVDGARVGRLDYRAVSLRGLAHQHRGDPRQDAYLVRPTPNGRWLVACVADGVSEGTYSHEAADLVCQEFTRVLAVALRDASDKADAPSVLAGLPWQAAVREASESIRLAATRLVREAERRRRSSGDPASAAPPEEPEQRDLSDGEASRMMAAALVAAVVSARPGPDGRHAYVVAGVGDCAGLTLADGAWTPLTHVKNQGAEIASSVVQGLPRASAAADLVTGRSLAPGEALLLITDGIGDSLGGGRGLVGRFLASRWSTAPDLLTFAHDAAFYRRTHTDDRTAVMVWTRPE